jgi:hypothetical protein
MIGDSEPKYREMFFTAGRVMNIKLPPRRCFLHPWLSEQTITLITGFRGVGKTWFGLGIAKAISTGAAFGPWECRDIAKVMYIDGELPLMDMQDRIRGIGLDPENQNLIFYLDSIAEMNGYARPNLGNEEWRDKMLTVLTDEKIDVVNRQPETRRSGQVPPKTALYFYLDSHDVFFLKTTQKF